MRSRQSVIDQVSVEKSDELGIYISPEDVGNCWLEYRAMLKFALSPASKTSHAKERFAQALDCSINELDEVITFVLAEHQSMSH